LPPAADYGVQHCEPSVLHVVVEAVNVWDSTDLGVRESCLLSSVGTRFRALCHRGRSLRGVSDSTHQIHSSTVLTGA